MSKRTLAVFTCLLLVSNAQAALPSYYFSSSDLIGTIKMSPPPTFLAFVEEEGERIYRVTLTSEHDLNTVGFFVGCIAAYATAKAGFTRFVMVYRGIGGSGKATLAVPVLLLRANESPSKIAPGYNWDPDISDVTSSSVQRGCEPFLAKKYHWWE
jgi:hypothetical protein